MHKEFVLRMSGMTVMGDPVCGVPELAITCQGCCALLALHHATPAGAGNPEEGRGAGWWGRVIGGAELVGCRWCSVGFPSPGQKHPCLEDRCVTTLITSLFVLNV